MAKNAFTMDNEPRRAPPVKYAKQVTRTTYARLSVAEGARSANRNHRSTQAQCIDRYVDWSIVRRRVARAVSFCKYYTVLFNKHILRVYSKTQKRVTSSNRDISKIVVAASGLFESLQVAINPSVVIKKKSLNFYTGCIVELPRTLTFIISHD